MDNHYSITNAEKTTTEETETYSVTYNTNGYGEQPESLTNVSALPSELPFLIDSGDRYRFDGWYTDETLIISASPNEILISDVTLYAKWIDDEAPITWGVGGIETKDGSINSNSARGNTDYIRVRTNGIITVTNMSEYTIVDVAVYKADVSYISLTKKYTLTDSDGTWTIALTDFATNYPEGQYIRFSVKRTDAANVAVSEFDDTTITST